MAEARTIMPGGVSSPVRAFKSVGGEPIVFDRVKGSKAYDVDGNEYVDYVGTWGPAIVGHADDRVLDAIKETMDKKFGQMWHCVIGEGFGFEIMYPQRNMIFIYYGEIGILVYKC